MNRAQRRQQARQQKMTEPTPPELVTEADMERLAVDMARTTPEGITAEDLAAAAGELNLWLVQEQFLALWRKGVTLLHWDRDSQRLAVRLSPEIPEEITQTDPG
jgi:hypothetical protein